jgi:hypothetical protein
MSENGTIGKGMRLRECEVVYRSRLIDVVVRRASSREDVYRLFGSLGTTGRARRTYPTAALRGSGLTSAAIVLALSISAVRRSNVACRFIQNSGVVPK